MKFSGILFATIIGIHSSLAQTAPPLTLRQTVPLPEVKGKFDHFAVDLAGNRLFVSATGNHSVEAINLTTGKVERSITELGKPHGLIWDEHANKLYVADGALSSVLVYTDRPGARMTLTGELKLSDDADDMTYNPAKHLLFVGHGGTDAANPPLIAVIDTDSFTIKTNLPVAAHPEALGIDLDSQRVFANIAKAGEIAVVDAGGKTVTNTWKLSNASDNVPIAYDPAYHTLYVACREPAVLLMLDAATGKEIARITTGKGADDLFLDPNTHRVYVISGAGEVDVYQANAKGSLQSLGVVPTVTGAKTGLLVPSQATFYVAIPETNGKPAEIRIYATNAK